MADCQDRQCSRVVPRRSILKLALGGVCAGVLSPVAVLGQGDPASLPPQEGDLLVKRDDSGSKPLGPADILGNTPPLMAFPMDPVSRVVRNANRLNTVLLIRLKPAAAGTTENAEGVLAYSGLCPHAGCDVTDWLPQTGVLSCDCHSSEFDATANGRVVGGPAARPLPSLPLKIDGATLVVAKPFASSIRFDE
jgi:ubiquinol-cytochrome c reductase iron-sulfur subunit/rieske iron-sulfur protein